MKGVTALRHYHPYPLQATRIAESMRDDLFRRRDELQLHINHACRSLEWVTAALAHAAPCKKRIARVWCLDVVAELAKTRHYVEYWILQPLQREALSYMNEDMLRSFAASPTVSTAMSQWQEDYDTAGGAETSNCDAVDLRLLRAAKRANVTWLELEWLLMRRTSGLNAGQSIPVLAQIEQHIALLRAEVLAIHGSLGQEASVDKLASVSCGD
jgi:hypothetical protein